MMLSKSLSRWITIGDKREWSQCNLESGMNPGGSPRKTGIRRFKVAQQDWYHYSPSEVSRLISVSPDDEWKAIVLLF
jgi:hypothetical protein